VLLGEYVQAAIAAATKHPVQVEFLTIYAGLISIIGIVAIAIRVDRSRNKFFADVTEKYIKKHREEWKKEWKKEYKYDSKKVRDLEEGINDEMWNHMRLKQSKKRLLPQRRLSKWQTEIS